MHQFQQLKEAEFYATKMMSVESSEQVNLDKTYKPTFRWSQIDPGAGELTYRPSIMDSCLQPYRSQMMTNM